MKIGIIGLGIVGSACKFGFEKNGHHVSVFDTNPDLGYHTDEHWNKLVSETIVVYLCVPTPANSDGSCNTAIIEEVVSKLAESQYKGVVVVKSTVAPGTTERLRKEYTTEISLRGMTQNRIVPFKDIIKNPEFLREKNPDVDMVELNRLLLVGCYNKESFELVKECHGDFPWESIMVTPTQAELVKYYHNCFGALRVTLANEFYELCRKMGQDYQPVKRAFLKAGGLPDRYFDVNENCRGWSSICFNKDLIALLSTAKDNEIHMPMVQSTVSANELYKPTPFANTRE